MICGETTVHHIGCRTSPRVCACLCGPFFPLASPLQALPKHQAGHRLAADLHSRLLEPLVDPRGAVGLPGSTMDVLDPLRQDSIFLPACRRGSIQPCAVSASGVLQQTTHHGRRIGCPVGFHEIEDPSWSEPVSRADQAAAFPGWAPGQCSKRSRSRRTCMFSRRSRLNASRSAVVSPNGHVLRAGRPA